MFTGTQVQEFAQTLPSIVGQGAAMIDTDVKSTSCWNPYPNK